MMKEQAIVTGLDGHWAIVQMQRKNTCSHCELNKGCGTGAIGKLLGHRSKPIKIKNEYALAPGDSLELGLPDRVFLKASLLIYGLPLLGLIVAGMLSQVFFGESELLSLAFAAAGFMAGLQISASLAQNQYSDQLSPKVLQVRGEPTS
jgi:sigma-E factor negative regulatory protein RseC